MTFTINQSKNRPSTSGGSRKNIWGPDPSSFGRQQRLSEITIEQIKNGGARFGACAPPALA